MIANAVSLSIIIPNWNTRDLLDACLRSLNQPGAMPDRTEVIVVDDASTDDSVAYVRENFPLVRVIALAVNSGFVAATNRGLEEANGTFLLLLNSDTEVQPGALGQMLAQFGADPAIGVIGADIRNPDGSPQPCRGYRPSLLSEIGSICGFDRKARSLGDRFRHTPPPGRLIPADWVLGAALMTRRTAYRSVGPLDPAYFMYSEEVDWCTRMHAAGWKLGTLTGAIILHRGGGTTRQTSDRMRPALFRSKIRYLAKHRSRAAAQVFRIVVRMIAAVHMIEGRLTHGHAREEVTSWRAVWQTV